MMALMTWKKHSIPKELNCQVAGAFQLSNEGHIGKGCEQDDNEHDELDSNSEDNDDDGDYSKDGDGNSNDSKKRGLPTGQPALTEQ